jgi:hypothetical protein
MGVAPWLKVYIADEMCSGRFFMSVILLVDDPDPENLTVEK